MRTIIALALLLINLPVNAKWQPPHNVTSGDPFEIRFTYPTERENGEPIGLIDIKKATVYWNCTNGNRGHKEIKSPISSVTLDTTTMSGDCEFRMTTTDVENRYSAFSDSLWRYISKAKIAAPADGGFR